MVGVSHVELEAVEVSACFEVECGVGVAEGVVLPGACGAVAGAGAEGAETPFDYQPRAGFMPSAGCFAHVNHGLSCSTGVTVGATTKSVTWAQVVCFERYEKQKIKRAQAVKLEPVSVYAVQGSNL